MEDKQTIPQILESVAEEICQKYCKWPDQWDEEEKGELSESDICANCALNRLT